MKRVFIVEPDRVLCAAYQKALEEFEVYGFSTANMAVRALEKTIPDVIILELALPVHNGFEFLYELFSYSDTRSIKLVINSFIHEKDIPWGFLNRGDFTIAAYLHKTLSSPQAVLQAARQAVA